MSREAPVLGLIRRSETACQPAAAFASSNLHQEVATISLRFELGRKQGTSESMRIGASYHKLGCTLKFINHLLMLNSKPASAAVSMPAASLAYQDGWAES